MLIEGYVKPDERLFQAALDALGVTKADYGRAVMVGNNLERDIAGANLLALISVFFHLNDRRRTHPVTDEETPSYVVRSPAELIALIRRLDAEKELPLCRS